MKNQMVVLLTVLGFGLFTCKDKPLEPERINPRDPEYIGPKLTELETPKNNEIVDTRQLAFTWKTAENAERYQFQAGTTANFDAAAANTIRIDTTVAQNSVKVPRRFEPAAINAIFWRVRGINLASGATLYGDWTQPFKVNLIKPVINVTPDSLKTQMRFNALCPNATQDYTITIKNVGKGDLSFSSEVSDTARPPNFVITNGGGPGKLIEGSSRQITVRFKPVSGGDKTEDLQITSNDRDQEKITIKLAGTGSTPALQVDPDPGEDESVDFEEVLIGELKPQDFVLKNNGSRAFKIRDMRIQNFDADRPFAFRQGTSRNFTLNPNESRSVTVFFAPNDFGERMATLRIEVEECNFSKTINLKGNGI